MRRWIVGTVLVCAALAVATLPPEAPGFVFGEVRSDATPERLRASELRQEVLVAQEALARRRWVDSLTALTRGAADRPDLLVVGTPRDVRQPELIDATLSGLAQDAQRMVNQITRLSEQLERDPAQFFFGSRGQGVLAE